MENIYLHDISLKTAWKVLTQALTEEGLWQVLGIEEIPLDENALGRVLAKPVWAQTSSPHYHAAAMDGFALRANDTRDATPNHPVDLAMSEQAIYVDTGDPMPTWANAVVPIEQVEPLDAKKSNIEMTRKPEFLRLRAALTPWMHIRPMGEDIIATQLVLPSGHTLRPVDLGAIAGSGFDKIWYRVSQKWVLSPPAPSWYLQGPA